MEDKKDVFPQHNEKYWLPSLPCPPTPRNHSPQCTEKVGVLPDPGIADVSLVFSFNFVFNYCHAGLKKTNLVCPRWRRRWPRSEWTRRGETDVVRIISPKKFMFWFGLSHSVQSKDNIIHKYKYDAGTRKKPGGSLPGRRPIGGWTWTEKWRRWRKKRPDGE